MLQNLVQMPSFTSIGNTVIELRESKKLKKKKKMKKHLDKMAITVLDIFEFCSVFTYRVL